MNRPPAAPGDVPDRPGARQPRRALGHGADVFSPPGKRTVRCRSVHHALFGALGVRMTDMLLARIGDIPRSLMTPRRRRAFVGEGSGKRRHEFRATKGPAISAAKVQLEVLFWRTYPPASVELSKPEFPHVFDPTEGKLRRTRYRPGGPSFAAASRGPALPLLEMGVAFQTRDLVGLCAGNLPAPEIVYEGR